MKRVIKKVSAILLAIVLLWGIGLNINTMVVFAEEEEDIPQVGVSYTLTYPDGTVVKEKDGNPLTYEDVQEALKEENWKLLGSDYISDENGKVNLPASWQKGTIKIIETVVPEGYTQGSESEKIVELEDGSVTFVNPKEKEKETTFNITYKLNGGTYNGKTEDIVESYPLGTVIKIHEAPQRAGYVFDYWEGSKYYPGDSYTVKEDHTFIAQWKAPTTPTDKPNVPDTRDRNNLLLYLGMFMTSIVVMGLFGSAKHSLVGNGRVNKRKINLFLVALLFPVVAGTLLSTVVYAADGFVINKVDDNDDQVEGAHFDVYGKPVVTYIENVDITLTKTWSDGSNQDGIRPSSDEYVSKVTLKANDNAVETTPIVVDNGDNTYTVTWKDQILYDLDSEITYTVEESDIEGYTKGSVTGDSLQGFALTNTHTPEMVHITGEKTWPSEPLMGWEVPTSITINLEKKVGTNWNKIDSKTVSADASSGKWTYDFGEYEKYEDGQEIEYRVVEEPVAGYKASGGTKADDYNITNEYDSRTITLTKTWEGDSNAPAGTRPDELMFMNYLTLRCDDEQLDVFSVTSEAVDNGDNTYTITFTLPYTNAEGTEHEYVIEEINIPNYTEGQMFGGMDEGFTVTNTYTPTAGITLNTNFKISDTSESWIAKKVQVDSNNPQTATINVGSEEKEVYVYNYTYTQTTIDPTTSEEVEEEITETYYGDWYAAEWVKHWYDTSGNEITSQELINALKQKATLSMIQVDAVKGLFKDNISKTISVTGPNGFNKTYTVTLGKNDSIEIPITEPGDYTITHEVAVSEDIDNDTLEGMSTPNSMVYMIQSAVVIVTKNGNDFECSVNKDSALISENTISWSHPYTLSPYDELYPESNQLHYPSCNTSASGNTVTFNHYIQSVYEQ